MNDVPEAQSSSLQSPTVQTATHGRMLISVLPTTTKEVSQPRSLIPGLATNERKTTGEAMICLLHRQKSSLVWKRLVVMSLSLLSLNAARTHAHACNRVRGRVYTEGIGIQEGRSPQWIKKNGPERISSHLAQDIRTSPTFIPLSQPSQVQISIGVGANR